MNTFKALFDLILPRHCIICGRRLNVREEYCCLSCHIDIPLTYFWEQVDNRMAIEFRKKTGDDLSRAVSLFFYREDSSFRQITRHLKYEYGIGSGRHFSKMLAYKLKDEGIFDDVDLIVPVPLHWTRKWSRGYNQAEVIASSLSRVLDIKMDNGLLKRCRRTGTQTKLSGDAKSGNVAGAFKLKKGIGSLQAEHILLVDDVYTSGSTLAECHKAIRKAGNPELKISVATLAFIDK